MSPETNVEYTTSPNFPVLHTEFHKFSPGQVPGKSLVIYEPRESVLSGFDKESILVRNVSPEFSVLYASSESSQGRFLSQNDEHGYYFWVIQSRQNVRVWTMYCSEGSGGFRKDLPVWSIKDGKLINQFPNILFNNRMSISSEAEIALIPVISEYSQHSGLIFCDQSDLVKPEVKSFLEEILGGKTRLPLDKTQMDIPVLTEAVKV